MLANVVAHAQHECGVDACLVAELGSDFTRLGYHLAPLPHEIDRVGPLLESRSAHDHVALRVHHERVAVEHQLVLPTEQVHIGHR